jgi:hypothetical protein
MALTFVNIALSKKSKRRFWRCYSSKWGWKMIKCSQKNEHESGSSKT